MRSFGIFAAFMVVLIALPSCTVISSYNTFQRRDEQVKQAWTQLLSVYQKRADLVPNLVSTVSGYATHEHDTLTEVAQARASVGQMKLPDNATPEQLAQFAEAQKALGAGMGRLMLVAESNPDLKANENFKALQTELSQVETQVVAARNRYVKEVTAYNINVRSWPTVIVAKLFGYTAKSQLSFDNEKTIQNAPKVDFGGKK